MYFIKIESDTNSGQIIKNMTTLESFKHDFEIIYSHLNKNGEYFYELSDYKMYIRKNENVLRKGYIYNTKVNVIKNVYTLSLIKCNEELSELFVKNVSQQGTQTNNIPAMVSIETQVNENVISPATICVETQVDTNITVPNISIKNSEIDSLGARYTRFQQQQDPFDCWNDLNSWTDLYQPKFHKKITTPPPLHPSPPTPPPPPTLQMMHPIPKQMKISNNPFDYFTQDLLNEFTSELKNKLSLPNHGLNKPSNDKY